jgi:hypothetical protein
VIGRRTRRLLGTAVVTAVLSGCGITAQDRPETINRDDVPFGLLKRAPKVAATTTTTHSPTSVPSVPGGG